MSQKDWSADDRAQREKLERASPTGSRVDVCGMLNRMARGDAGRELPGLGSYAMILAMQKRGRDIGRRNEKFERMLATGRLDRVHPDSPLKRGQVADAGGSLTSGDARAQDHFASGKVKPIEPEWLTIEQMRTVAAAKAMNSRYW